MKEGYRWLNPAAFRAPAPGTYGNLEANSLVAPNWFNVDLGLVRSFRVGGERQIQFRAEVFNLLNRVHLDQPVYVAEQSELRAVHGNRGRSAHHPARR